MRELDERIIPYNDGTASELFRGIDKSNISNFWNEPFPEDLVTENGNIANFNKTYNKKQTSLFNRKCSIKLEVGLSNGNIEEHNIGNFIISGLEDDDDDSVQLKLEDLVKSLTSISAEKVKSGYQWYRNIPLKILVEELIKTKYFDVRNGEIPRDFIIEGSRLANFNSELILSTLGKPPGFSRLYTSFENQLTKTRVICKANIDGNGEKLYLGIDNQLWYYDELVGIYVHIDNIFGSFPEKTFNIKKLWFNNESEIVDRAIYGIAIPDEELVNSEMGDIDLNIQYSCPIGNEFIIFKATNDAITVLFDSSNNSHFNNTPGFKSKLFTGEYHIVPPFFKGVKSTYEKWRTINTAIEVNALQEVLKEISHQAMSNIGMFNGIGTIMSEAGVTYYPGFSENITIPFVQSVGFICNKNPMSIMPTWGEGLKYSRERLKFGINEYWEEGSWLNSDILLLHSRPRTIIYMDKTLNKINQKFDRDNYDSKVNFIISTTSYTNKPDSDRLFDSLFPAIDYDTTNKLLRSDNFGYKFHPGYFSWYDESIIYNKNPYYTTNDWKNIAWPWLKYTSGQSGCNAYLPNYGNKGGIFMVMFDKTDKNGNSISYEKNQIPYDFHRRCITQEDITDYSLSNANLTDADPREIRFRYFVFDLETLTFDEKTSLKTSLVRTTNSQIYPMQPTCIAVDIDNNDIYLGLTSFTNKNSYYDGYPFHYSHINKLTITKSTIASTNIYTTDDDIFTEMQVISNGTTKRLLISGYNKSKVIKEESGGVVIDKCFFLATHDLINNALNLLIIQQSNYSLYQYKNLTKSLDFNKSLYVLTPKDRDERSNGCDLYKLTFNDLFECESFESLGDIEQIVSKDSNVLSNLELIKYNNAQETIFGTSSGYYNSPINKIDSKNHLWKYDAFIAGIIELADMSGLKVWDAISSLAEGFNHLTGFSGESFFFVPKSISSEPDIIFDLDLDTVISCKKTQDSEVKNILRVVPNRVSKGDVTWEIILANNEAPANPLTGEILVDEGRENLELDMKVRQDDDLTKDIILQVIEKGIIPYGSTSTNLRMGYLIYNTVIESKTVKNIGEYDTEIYLPSFFGTNVEEQLGIGDVIAVSIEDDNEEQITQIYREIKEVDFSRNIVVINEAFHREIEAYTPLSIYRSFITNPSSPLRNNSWSNQGVTYLIDGIFNTGEDGTYVEVSSIQHLSVNTVVKFGNLNSEYKIINKRTTSDHKNYIYIEFYNGSNTFPSGDLANTVVRAFWVPMVNQLNEVGGSKVFVGFTEESRGSFWVNSKGSDKIEIKCPGLKVEQDSKSTLTLVDNDSLNIYGEFEDSIDDNRFISINLLEHLTRTQLNWSSKPKYSFKITDVIQGMNRGGEYYNIPQISVMNTKDRRLYKVRLVSKKRFARYPGYYVDTYITSHDFNLSTFRQDLSLRALDPY
jgi:hypothetical protein